VLGTDGQIKFEVNSKETFDSVSTPLKFHIRVLDNNIIFARFDYD